MNLLDYRKRILIAESELNRAQLVREIRELHADVRRVSRCAPPTWRTVLPSVIALALDLAALARRPEADPPPGPSRMNRILMGLLRIATLGQRP
ncbi:MAG: hypothetical protein U1E27_04070 [Kiritimatiellia bacterium]|nr:hypothetical protein [Kiritimatiellia bacterium]